MEKEELIEEIRKAFALYVYSEGCGCCMDSKKRKVAEESLGKLLNCDQYKDGSGYNWYKFLEKNK